MLRHPVPGHYGQLINSNYLNCNTDNIINFLVNVQQHLVGLNIFYS